MKSNKQWLNELAATDPQALRAWFDAEHFECPSDTQSTKQNMSQLFENLSDDSREQLELDIDWCLGSYTATSVNVQRLKSEIIKWLDRQAAITAHANTELINNQAKAVVELQRKLDNLSHDLAESERFREEMREELSIAYDHAHDLLARRDRGAGMSEIKALEKLREHGEKVKSSCFTCVYCDAVLSLADEIEAEIAEGYMEQPVDRNGEPWHIGDKFAFTGADGRKHICTVSGVSDCEVFFYYDEHSSSTKHRHFTARAIAHVKPRTLEDVLMDAGVSRAAISDVAAEIRELLGGDE